MGLCISHSCTIRLVERLGENFDSHVNEWKDKVVRVLQVHTVISTLAFNYYVNMYLPSLEYTRTHA